MKKPKQLLIITYYWPPSGGAGVQRWLKLSKYLSQLGVRVQVLTVHEDFALYPQLDPHLCQEAKVDVLKTKAFLPSFLKKQKKVPFGGFVTETKEDWKQKLVKWVRGNLVFPDPRVGWNKFAFKQACALVEQGVNNIITTSPPHSTQLIGLKLKKKYGNQINWISDFRDPWTDIYYFDQLGIGPEMLKKHKNAEQEVVAKCDHLLTVGDTLKAMLLKKAEILEEKIKVVPNGYDEADFKDLESLNVKYANLTYAGTLGEKYNLEGLCKTLSNIQEPFLFRFIGNIHPKWRVMLEKNQHIDFEWIESLPHLEALTYLEPTQKLLLVIPEVQQNECILTGKLFEYLRSQKPILGLGPIKGDAAEVLSTNNAGEMFDYADVDGILEFLLKKEIKKTSSAISKYARDEQAQGLLTLLK